MDLDAVEAQRMKLLEVKVVARIGGKSFGEAGLLKRVLRYDTATESFLWCGGRRSMPLLLFSSQDGATTSARRQTFLARRALVRLCETETRSSMGT